MGEGEGDVFVLVCAGLNSSRLCFPSYCRALQRVSLAFALYSDKTEHLLTVAFPKSLAVIKLLF